LTVAGLDVAEVARREVFPGDEVAGQVPGVIAVFASMWASVAFVTAAMSSPPDVRSC
jgi:hypothetical protein